MNLEVLISTNNEGIYNIKNILLVPIKNIIYFICHQVNEKEGFQFKTEREDVKYRKVNAKGLSKNRNLCLSKASGDICLLADDDVNYSKKYLKKIIQCFEENADADIITFKVKTNPSEPDFNNYLNFPFWHNIRTIFTVSSIEIAFRLESIKKAEIKFDENFGIASKFSFCEENIFLMDALTKGLKIKFLPHYIVNHKYERSFLGKIETKEQIIAIGAVFYRMFGLYCFLFIFYYIIYNYIKHKSPISFIDYIKFSFRGIILSHQMYNKKKKISLICLLKLIINFLEFLIYLILKKIIKMKKKN